MPSRECWFKSLPGAGPCDGRLVRCHLITRQQIATAIKGQMKDMGWRWDSPETATMVNGAIMEPSSWVWGCGGPMGPSGHHGQFKPDGPRTIDRHLLPVALEEFAAELGLSWWLDRTYGPRSFPRGEDGHTVTVDGAAAHAGTMHRDPLTGLYL